MIQKSDVIDFFNRHAATWDEELVRNEPVLAVILDTAGIGEGTKVLDIACGTGVMVPYYLKRGAAFVTGVDISPEMVKIAREKFPEPNVTFLCADAECDDLGTGYDAIMIYNAFPHFPNPDRLLARLASLLRPGGTLTVAHGMSREKIDAHHSGAAHSVSNGLMPAEVLVEMLGKYTEIMSVISNDDMYLVSGKKQEEKK